MKNIFKWPPLWAFAMLLVAAVGCAGQTGTATVTVIDRSRLTVIVSPLTYTGEVGDTIRFTAVAVDTISGDTIAAVLQWRSANDSAVAIEPTSGLATLLQAGTWTVFADVQQIVSMLIFRQQDDGSYREVFVNQRAAIYAATGVVPDSLKMVVGESAMLCAYLEADDGTHYVCDDCDWSSTDETVVTVTNGLNDLCPTWQPGFPFPTAALREPLQFIRGSVQVG